MKVVKSLLVSAICATLFSGTVLADIPKDKIDSLSDHELTTLAASIQIALLSKSTGERYSDILDEDLSNYSADELKEMKEYIWAVKDGLSGENETGEGETDGLIGAVICDYKLFTITVTDAEIRNHAFTGETDLVLYVDLVNDNDFEYEGYVDTVTVNGWQVDKLFWFNLKGGNKQKEKVVLKINDLGISSLDDVESLSISFHLLYAQYAITTDEVSLELK